MATSRIWRLAVAGMTTGEMTAEMGLKHMARVLGSKHLVRPRWWRVQWFMVRPRWWRVTWFTTQSLIFAIGTIQSNEVKYRKSACWEECPCAPDDETMRDHRVVKMTGPFPPDEDRCGRLVNWMSESFYPPHTKEDKSASWVRIQTVRQISPQRNLPHTQKLIISAGSNRSHRSQSAQRARLANMARRMDIAA